MKPIKLKFWLSIILKRPIQYTIPFGVGVLMLLGLIFLLVRYTGGTHTAYAHAMYLPVIIAAVLYGYKGGVIVAIIAGLLLGPIMPLDTALGLSQTFVNWFYRLLYFVGVGLFVGLIMDMIYHQYRVLQETMTHYIDTGLPNYMHYLSSNNEHEVNEDDLSMTLIINNYDEISALIGRENYVKLLREVYEELESFFNEAIIIQMDYRRFWIESNKEEFKNRFSELVDYFDRKVFLSDEVPTYLEICFGVFIAADEGYSRLEAFRASETAALHAKKYKLKYAVYQDDYQRANINLKRLGALPLAIKNNELFLEYHPIIDLKTNKVTMFEALIRWNYQGEIIPPLDFIPLAEETKIIDDITEWLVNQVVMDYPTLNKHADIMININVSQRNLYNPELVEKMIQTIRKENFNKTAIGIEMTESTVMLNLSITKALLRSLQDNGIPLSIDDFGVGYSTLSCLNELPVDKIKIDRDFASRITKDENSRKIVQLIVEYAHSLGIKVVAEGVETEALEDALKALKVDYGQGFYYSKSKDISSIVEWMINYNKGDG